MPWRAVSCRVVLCRAAVRPSRPASASLLGSDSPDQPLMMVSRALKEASSKPANKFVIPWSNITLGEEIASGASGRVYRGTYDRNPVAVKQVFCGDDTVATEELAQEVQWDASAAAAGARALPHHTPRAPAPVFNPGFMPTPHPLCLQLRPPSKSVCPSPHLFRLATAGAPLPYRWRF
jgi:hypothetical protein